MVLDISLGSYYGIDSAVDFAILLVSFLIAYQSYKIYKVVGERNYKYFSWSFASIAISFFFKIISNLTVLHKVYIENANFILTLAHEVQEIQLLNFFSAILFRVFFIIGFLFLFFVTTRTNKKEEIFIFIYFSLVSVVLSIYFSFVFHLSVFMILAVMTIYFYENNKKVKSLNSNLVFAAFVFILVSQVTNLLYSLNELFYIFGEALLFVGFLILLFNHIKIRNGKKKNETGSNQGYTRNFEKK